MKKGFIALLVIACCAALAVPTLAFAGASSSDGKVSSQSDTTKVASGDLVASAAEETAPLATQVESAINAPKTTIDATETPLPTVPNQTTQSQRFIDNNNDGVCDNYESGLCPGVGQGYGNGVCQGQGQGYGNGYGAGAGQGYGYNQGNPNCPAYGYVDTDGDGVCDNYGQACPGNGRHHGGRHC